MVAVGVGGNVLSDVTFMLAIVKLSSYWQVTPIELPHLHVLLCCGGHRASENVATTNGFAQRALLLVPACRSKGDTHAASEVRHARK